MENKKEPFAPQPAPEGNEAPAAPVPADAFESAPAAPATAPISEPVAAPAAPVAGPVPAPTQPIAAPQPAPEAPAAPAAAPAQPTAPVAAPVPAPAAAPTQPVAPAPEPSAPTAPAAPVAPTAPVAQPTAPQPAPMPESPFGQTAQMPGAPVQQPVSDPTQPFAAPQQPPVNGGYGAYPAPAAPAGLAPRSGKAIGALVCGIFAILLSGFPIVGVVLGIVAIVLAGKAVKEAGKDGKATGGKVCGIIGIVLSILWFVAGLLLTMGILASDWDVVTSTVESSSSVPSATAPSDSSVGMTADEKAAAAAVEAELDKYKNQDSAVMSALAAELDESLLSIDDMEMSHSSLGVDLNAYAAWAVTDFSYTIDSVFIDESAGTATVYVNTTERDSFEVYSRFNDLLTEYDQSGTPQNSDLETVKADVRDLWNQAMDETTVMSDYFAAFDLVKSGDSWVVDPESLDEEVDYIFGTF